jgi:proline racemase
MRVIDSHTEGEPTRVVVAGWPRLRAHDMAGRRDELIEEWDHLRRAVVCEPRGHDAVVGALLTTPVSADAAAGVVFFNNAGCLGMCGHGLIGVVRTLEHLGRAAPGDISIDTPVGRVSARLGEGGAVTIRNVTPHVHALDIAVDVPGIGRITGDVAWGGNWFFITHLPDRTLDLAHAADLTQTCARIRDALDSAGITGADGAEIDHVELTAVAADAGADSVNFVLCPGGAYDRSPCGTGTSAKLAVMHERGQLDVGRQWRQRSIAGGLFTAWLERDGDDLRPCIHGHAYITAESVLRFDPADPLRAGIGGG